MDSYYSEERLGDLTYFKDKRRRIRKSFNKSKIRYRKEKSQYRLRIHQINRRIQSLQVSGLLVIIKRYKDGN